ncbi:MAG: PAS domain-containing protein [Lentisphaeria bacterium]|nr:PAS domain-containing protein [Lentisphaeria bacterium]
MGKTPTSSRDWAEWTPLLKIMGARVVVLGVVLASLIAVAQRGDGADYLPFYLFMVVALTVTVIYALGVRSKKTAAASVINQFAVDPLVVTGMVYFTGGVNSQLYLLYPLLILAAGIAVSGRHALHVTVLSVLLYSLLTAALYFGILVVPGAESAAMPPGLDGFQNLLFRNMVFIMVGGATTYFTNVLTRQEAAIERIGVVASSILENVGTALLAVDAQGKVVSVNQAAASLLGQREEDLRGGPLTALFEGDTPDIARPRHDKKVWMVRRKGEAAFPAFCAVSKGKFPPAPSAYDQDGADLRDMYLLTLFDMSDSTNTGSAGEHRETVAVVNEIAHVVRNPLTAIRGAGELLSNAVDQMFAGSGQLSSDDWEMIKTMSHLIFEQSLELDDKVKDFLEGVAEGSTQVEEALREARRWTDTVGKTP